MSSRFGSRNTLDRVCLPEFLLQRQAGGHHQQVLSLFVLKEICIIGKPKYVFFLFRRCFFLFSFCLLYRRDRPRRNEAGVGVTPLTGLKGLGVREMSFKICLLAVDVQTEGESRREQVNQDTKEVSILQP